jgi:hypothetical protein
MNRHDQANEYGQRSPDNAKVMCTTIDPDSKSPDLRSHCGTPQPHFFYSMMFHPLIPSGVPYDTFLFLPLSFPLSVSISFHFPCGPQFRCSIYRVVRRWAFPIFLTLFQSSVILLGQYQVLVSGFQVPSSLSFIRSPLSSLRGSPGFYIHRYENGMTLESRRSSPLAA